MKRMKNAIQNFDIEEIFADGFRVRIWVNTRTEEGEELMANMKKIKELSDCLKDLMKIGERIAMEGTEDEHQN